MWTTNQRLQLAWVLHRRAYQDTGLILELFTSQYGRVGAVARGGRKNPLLQPFQPLLVQLQGQGELLSLRQHEAADQAVRLTGSALYCGIYLNEVLLRLLHRHDKQTALLGPYADTLEALARQAQPADVVLREFELLLLAELGYAVDFRYDAQGQAILPTQRYAWYTELGWQQASTGWCGEDILALGERQWTETTRRAGRDILRAILAPYLGHKPLHSRQLFLTHTNQKNT